MSDHGGQLRWKGQLGANPNPPCQLSLWEETGVYPECGNGAPRLRCENRSETYAFGLASCGKVLVSLENTSSASFLQTQSHNYKLETSVQSLKHASEIFHLK